MLSAGKRRIDDELRLGKQPGQMTGVVKTLCVDLVDVFGPRWSCGEPAAARGDLDAANRCIVAGSGGEDLLDRLARQLGAANLRAIELAEFLLLLGVCRGVHAIRVYRTQFLRQIAVGIAGIAAGACGNL